MNLNGRRESNNVEDRRRSGISAGVGRMGIGGVIIIALITWIMGGNPLDALQGLDVSQMGAQNEQTEQEFTPEEQELAKFSKQILAGTEDVWTAEFKKMGRKYEPPTLVLYTGATKSGCGTGQASMGPFYCSADQCVYIDLSFFTNMKNSIGADGDFCYAYVIAHEVGHHVQYLLGTLGQAHDLMARYGQGSKEANQISVRLELQADFYAGIWAHHDNKMFGSIEEGDVDEGLNAAQKIGDDYLQKKSRGYAVPESFNHGTSAQRSRWLKRGLTTGDIEQGDTFSQAYDRL